MDQLLTTIIGYGPAGVALVALIFALKKVDDRAVEANNARLKDAMEWQRTLAGNTSAMVALDRSVQEIRKALEAMEARLTRDKDR